MGFNKAQLNFHGTDQVNWLNDLLNHYCEQVFVSGSPEKIKGEYNFIEDVYDRGGPMNGILSAFRQHPDKAWVIVPVDMPNIDQNAIEFLIKNRNTTKLATCFLKQGKNIEPLPVLLETQAYPLLLKNFTQMKESLNEFLKENPTEKIMTEEIRWFVNVNYPG